MYRIYLSKLYIEYGFTKYRSDNVILGGPTWDVVEELSLSSLGDDSGGGRIICGAP